MDSLQVWGIPFSIDNLAKDEALAQVEELIANAYQIATEKPDLIVLPELFTCAFESLSSCEPEHVNGHQYRWLKLLASRYKTTIIAGLLVKEKDGKIYNRALISKPDGTTLHYDKQALFPMSEEAALCSIGNVTQNIFTLKGFRIKVCICYELRFPELCYNHFQDAEDIDGEYDLLICIAQWPAKRIAAWDILLQARAVENRSYVLGLNRTSKSPESPYIGHSKMLSYDGEIMSTVDSHPDILTFQIQKEALQNFRKQHPFVR